MPFATASPAVAAAGEAALTEQVSAGELAFGDGPGSHQAVNEAPDDRITLPDRQSLQGSLIEVLSSSQ